MVVLGTFFLPRRSPCRFCSISQSLGPRCSGGGCVSAGLPFAATPGLFMAHSQAVHPQARKGRAPQLPVLEHSYRCRATAACCWACWPSARPNCHTLTVGRSAQVGEQRSCCVCVLPAVPGPADSRHFARAEDHAGTRLLSRSHAHPPARGAFSRSVQVTQELQLGLPEDARRAMARARQHSFETATSSSYLRIDLAHNAALVQQATTQLVQAQSQQAAGSAASNAEDVQAQSAA